MFVVKKEEYVNRTLRIPKKLDEELHEYASMNDVSFTSLVIQCCKYVLENKKPLSEDGTNENTFIIEK